MRGPAKATTDTKPRLFFGIAWPIQCRKITACRKFFVHTAYIVVGSGIAGLRAAIDLAQA
jgi:heterodisulfide reductase subunit A-like polyferredoxin